MYTGIPVYFPFYIVLSGTEQYDVIIEYRFYATERDKKKIPFRNETGKQKTRIVEAYLELSLFFFSPLPSLILHSFLLYSIHFFIHLSFISLSKSLSIFVPLFLNLPHVSESFYFSFFIFVYQYFSKEMFCTLATFCYKLK